MKLEIIATLLVMATVVFAILAISDMLTARHRRTLAQMRRHNAPSESDSENAIGPGTHQEHAGTRFPLLEKIVGTGPTGEKTRIMLQQAGLRLRVGEYLAIRLTLAAAGFLMGLVVSKEPLLGLGGLILGYIIPGVVVGVIRSRRMVAFNSQIVECLEMISTALASGFSFLQGLEAVRQELPPPFSEEIGRSLRDISLGSSTEESLLALVKRTGDQDLKLAITAVLVQRRVGGNLSEVLNNIAGTLRERIRLRGEVNTLTAQARASGLIVGCLPVALAVMIYLINPEYMRLLFTETLGRYILGLALVMEVVGFILIKKMVEVEF